MPESRFTPGPWVRHDTADYAEIHPASGKQHSAIALVGKAADADLIAAAPEMHALLLRLIKWDTDFPVNSYNGYAGLKELDKIIADAKAVTGAGGEL
jgi:hypothetical protein